MRLISDWTLDAPVPGFPAVFTIGVFDGLHLGHQFLINKLISRARVMEVDSLLITFEPHPLSVLSNKYAPDILTTFEQKREILSHMGLSCLACLRFTKELAALGADDFLNTVLAPRLQPMEIFIGADFRFGRNAEGNYDMLAAWAKNKGAVLHSVEIQHAKNGETYASSHIRGLLKMGHVESAKRLLGRPYRIGGEVISGMKRGRALGFPTANLGKVEELIPGPGVYAVMAKLRGKSYPAMTSIGNNPTFKGQYLTVETYIFDFNDEFYGEYLSLDFIRRIRGMIRFDSGESLKTQLKKDEEEARVHVEKLGAKS